MFTGWLDKVLHRYSRLASRVSVRWVAQIQHPNLVDCIFEALYNYYYCHLYVQTFVWHNLERQWFTRWSFQTLGNFSKREQVVELLNYVVYIYDDLESTEGFTLGWNSGNLPINSWYVASPSSPRPISKSVVHDECTGRGVDYLWTSSSIPRVYLPFFNHKRNLVTSQGGVELRTLLSLDIAIRLYFFRIYNQCSQICWSSKSPRVRLCSEGSSRWTTGEHISLIQGLFTK